MNLDDETLLSAYLDGELDPALRLKLESELLSDSALADQLRGLAAVHDLVAGLPRPGLSGVDLSHSIVATIHRSPAASDPVPARRLRLAVVRTLAELAAAAVIFIAFSLVFRVTLQNLPPRPDHVPIASVRPPGALKQPEHVDERKAAERGPVQAEVAARAVGSHTVAARTAGKPHEGPEPARERDEWARRWIRDQLDSQEAIPVFLVDVIGSNAADRVDALVKSASRSESSYGRIQIGKGIVFDPAHPTEATVFTLVLDDRQRKRLRDDLHHEFPLAVEETSADPSIVTQLADVGQVAVLTAPKANLAADLVPVPDTPSRRRAIMAPPAERPEVGMPIPDEFEDRNVRVVRELRPPHPGQEEPTPEQERSAPHPSTRVADSHHPSAPGGRAERQDAAGLVRREAKARDDRRPSSIVLVWVARR